MDNNTEKDLIPLHSIVEESGYSRNSVGGLLPFIVGLVEVTTKPTNPTGGRPAHCIHQKDASTLIDILKQRRQNYGIGRKKESTPILEKGKNTESELLVLLRRLIHLSKVLSIDEICIADGKAVIERTKVVFEEVLP